ncbi:MAG: nicotinamide riboside transporter PnuC [Cardiobacteriaceae bacterium]|nr:nicotinamide riboside transporter PnuC [Cardiobacteriaceae bacterium]
MKILKKINEEWQTAWITLWFFCGAAALYAGTLNELATSNNPTFIYSKFFIALIGLLCVVSLTFRKNILGNGLGITANIGEIYVQYYSGATGLTLAPAFYLITHIFALNYWRKNQDGDGNMLPRSANRNVWLFTTVCIGAGLLFFPWLNKEIAQFRFIDNNNDPAFYLGSIIVNWYAINILAFVLGIAAQTSMILRYTYSWILWIIVNFTWLTVNLLTHNYIFAIQTIIYQINAFLALYEWWKNSQTHSKTTL